MTSMSNSFFGLRQGTFATTADPNYVFKPTPFRKVLSQIANGFRKGGTLAIVTGQPGTGKTTLCRYLGQKLPSHVVASIKVNALDSSFDVLRSICNELDIDYPINCENETVLVDHLRDFLARASARDNRTIFIIDDAQNVGYDLYQHLDLLRRSDNTQTIKHHFVLTGPVSLVEYLKSIGFRSESHDGVIQCKLAPMDRQDSISYIHHRLTVGGATDPIFTKAAESLIYRYAKGISRSINLICDHSLCIARDYSENVVTPSIVKQAVRILSPPALEENPVKRGLTLVADGTDKLAIEVTKTINNIWQFFQSSFPKKSADLQTERSRQIHAISWDSPPPREIIGQSFLAFNEAAANAFDSQPAPADFPKRITEDVTGSELDVYARDLLIPDGMVIVPDIELTSAYGGNEISVSNFLLDQTPVTNEMYVLYIEETNNAPPDHWWNKRPSRALLKHPVVGISFEEASRFAQWCGKRLPNGKEWEAAARRPGNNKFPWGDDWPVSYCNSPESGLNTSVAVDSNPAGSSADGCLDLVGNVWEWTDDGGGFQELEPGYAWVFGGSYRHECVIDGAISRSTLLKVNRYAYVGFRCARDLS